MSLARTVAGLTTALVLSASLALAATAFSDAQKTAISHLGAVTGTGLACGFGDIALPLKETVVTIADANNMDSDTRVAIREMFSKARDDAFAEIGANKGSCPARETYDVTARLAKVQLENAFK